MSLQVVGLTVRFAGEAVLDRVDLNVDPGQLVAVIGPSGCGKSTLLRAIAGLEVPNAGTIGWAGTDLTTTPTDQRDFGMVFQTHALFTHRSVGDNVGFGLKMAGVAAAERQERIAELLELVGLGGFGDRRPDTLSGGEAQRVALARALAPRPRLLLLDEPFAALDAPRRAELTAGLVKLLRDLDQTAILVTHDQGEALAIADRVAVMAPARVARCDTPAQVWADPRSEFVARFLGHGPIIEHQGRRVAVRPEAVSFTATADPSLHSPLDSRPLRPAAIAGRVVAATFAGDRFEIEAQAQPPAGPHVYRGYSTTPLPIGSPVTIDLDPAGLSELAEPG